MVRDTGGYLVALCLLNLVIFVGLFWQVSRLSRRPDAKRAQATAGQKPL